jgi:hypothetical protein
MAIKVRSVNEQYTYVHAHPHDCSPDATWDVTGHATTFDNTSQVMVCCKKCGLKTRFEFDDSAAWPKEFREVFGHDWKKRY